MKKIYFCLSVIINLFLSKMYCPQPTTNPEKYAATNTTQSKKATPTDKKAPGSTKPHEKSNISTSTARPAAVVASQRSTSKDQEKLNEELANAVKNNDIDEVRNALSDGADIQENSYNNLFTAIKNDNPELLQVLVDAGIKLETENDDLSLLIYAIEKNKNIKIAEILLKEFNIDPNIIQSNRSLRVLSEAIELKNLDMVKLLLNHNADINWLDRKNTQNTLYATARYGTPEILKELLDHNADIKLKNESYNKEMSGFHQAATRGRADMLKIFLDHIREKFNDDKSIVDMRDSDKKTALHHACDSNNSIECVKLLLDHDADIHARDKNRQTPLHLAAEKSPITTKMLLDAGAKIHDIDDQNNTALHHAAVGGQTEIAKLLLEHGAHVDRKNKEGQTALHLAARGNDSTTVDYLLKHGANPTEKDLSGKTALDYAPKGDDENPGLIELLKKHEEKQRQKEQNEKIMNEELTHYNIHENDAE